MSTPDEPACGTPTPQDYVASPRPPSQRETVKTINGSGVRRIEKWASEALSAEREHSIHSEYNRQLEALRIHQQELQARVAELECSVGRVGVVFRHLSSLESVFQGSTVHNSSSGGGDRRCPQYQHNTSNPHFQDQRREFSQTGDSRFRGGGERPSSFGGRGRARRGA